MTKSTALTIALAAASLSLPVQAQQLSEARIQELIRAAAERVASGQAAAPGAQAPAPAQPTRPVVRISLDDAVKFALDRNLDIAVSRLNPQINDIALSSARAVYLPSLTSTLFTQSTSTPSTTTLAGSNTVGAPVEAGLTTFNGGVAQSVPWGGGNFAVALNNNKQTTTNATALYNPQYNAAWSGTYTQPLLRNFHIDSTRQTIRVTALTRDISDVQLRALITNTLSNVRNAYWDYVYSVQAVDAARQTVALAQKLVDDNQTRVQVGTMAPLDVVTAQAQAATAQQALVTAMALQRTNELALKRLIVAGTSDPNWNAQIDPTDRPDFQPEPIDVDAAVRRALSQRTDLEIAKKNVEANDITLKYLRDQTLPQADFVANYGLNGLGGAQLQTTGTGINRVVTGSLPGGYGDALSTLFGRNYPRWTATINLSYPLGLSAQKASVARAQVQLGQVQAQLKQQELQVATEVTNAAINAQSGAEAVTAAIASRVLSQRKLDAEQSKFEVGMSTNYFVIQAQNDLATAQNAELRAILNYRKSLVELERLQQTTLQNLNITVVGR
jgi:outer membrane protein TolC